MWQTHAPLLCEEIVFETSQIRIWIGLVGIESPPRLTFYLLSCYCSETILLVHLGIFEADEGSDWGTDYGLVGLHLRLYSLYHHSIKIIGKTLHLAES